MEKFYVQFGPRPCQYRIHPAPKAASDISAEALIRSRSIRFSLPVWRNGPRAKTLALNLPNRQIGGTAHALQGSVVFQF